MEDSTKSGVITKSLLLFPIDHKLAISSLFFPSFLHQFFFLPRVSYFSQLITACHIMLEVVMLMESLMVLALLVVTQPLLHGPYRPRLQTKNNAWKVSHPPFHAFVHQQHATALFLQNKIQNDMEDGVSLTSLVDNEEIGIFLNNAIMQWLDEEYIPQDIHRILGEAVQSIYVKGRKNGVTDLGENTKTMTSFLRLVRIMIHVT